MRKIFKLTTVKILEKQYNDFRVIAVKKGMTLQKLVNRTIYRYITDDSYRHEIDNISELQISGSNF